MSNQHSGIWTDAMVEELRRLFAENLSGRLIAVALGRGVTRNQVIGKLNRLGLQRLGPTISKSSKPPKPTVVAGKTIRLRVRNASFYAELAAADVVPLHVSLFDLNQDQCRYPYGDGPFTFCGCQKIDDSSYCGPHHALTHGDQRQTAEAVALGKRAYRNKMIAEAA